MQNTEKYTAFPECWFSATLCCCYCSLFSVVFRNVGSEDALRTHTPLAFHSDCLLTRLMEWQPYRDPDYGSMWCWHCSRWHWSLWGRPVDRGMCLGPVCDANFGHRRFYPPASAIQMRNRPIIHKTDRERGREWELIFIFIVRNKFGDFNCFVCNKI